MPRTRVLVVDDSVIVRQIVSRVLSSEPDIEVVGAAPNGRIALAKLPGLAPDLVILDIDMPEMGGLETLEAIRKTHSRLHVIVFSSLTERGAAVTLDALARGASDYVAKPHGVSSAEEGVRYVRDQLLPKIRALCPSGPGTATIAVHPRRAQRPSQALVEIVAIGVSTGGPNALTAILRSVPPSIPVPIVIVQHMPPIFTRLLAERLTSESALRVREAVDGARLEPGRAWIAPGDCHLTVVREGRGLVARLDRGEPENFCRPSADVLLRSVARTCGAGTLAVILTGMGHDGVRGCECVQESGGQVLAQDRATSVVWGMPGLVAKANLADAVLPLDRMADEIMARVQKGRAASSGPAGRAWP